ncbi:hypothetical protein L7F22_053817 [Adiantum nelumboides]|nr:hypothetical protein [Adiantum nelumboides]
MLLETVVTGDGRFYLAHDISLFTVELSLRVSVCGACGLADKSFLLIGATITSFCSLAESKVRFLILDGSNTCLRECIFEAPVIFTTILDGSNTCLRECIFEAPVIFTTICNWLAERDLLSAFSKAHCLVNVHEGHCQLLDYYYLVIAETMVLDGQQSASASPSDVPLKVGTTVVGQEKRRKSYPFTLLLAFRCYLYLCDGLHNFVYEVFGVFQRCSLQMAFFRLFFSMGVTFGGTVHVSRASSDHQGFFYLFNDSMANKGKDKLPVEESSSSTRRHRRETAATDTQFMASARTAARIARAPWPSMTAKEQEENDLFTAQLMSMMGTFEQLAKNPRMPKLLKTKDYRTGSQAESSQQATS